MLPTAPQEEAQGSALEPPRFSLRWLLIWMTGLGCLFGMMVAVGKVAALLMLFFVSLVVAHVLGNSVGTRLRDRASRTMVDEHRSAPNAGLDRALEINGPRRLTQRSRLSRITPIVAVGGALIGGALGGTRFAETYPDSGWGAMTLGVVSSAVLGGFAGFVTTSFLSVARQAIREALADSDPVRAVHKPR